MNRSISTEHITLLLYNFFLWNLIILVVDSQFPDKSLFIMLTKTPKPTYKRLVGTALKWVFFAETFGIAVSYGLYFKLNTDREARLYMYRNCNWVLEAYYGLGEKIGGHKTRELDLKVWTNEGKIN